MDKEGRGKSAAAIGTCTSHRPVERFPSDTLDPKRPPTADVDLLLEGGVTNASNIALGEGNDGSHS